MRGPMQTECISEQLEFEAFHGRRVVAAFDGGAVTSDAGTVLLREADRTIALIKRVSACFTDHRDADQVIHALPTLIGQRIIAIALGYEDVNDHDSLRFDPVLALFADRLEAKRKDCAALAGKSTVNRLEHAPRNGGDRYHKIGMIRKRSSTSSSTCSSMPTPRYRRRSFLISTPPMIPCMATRRAVFSTAITTVSATCRSTCSAAGISWRRRSGDRTSMPRRGPRTRWRASLRRSAGAGRRCASSCAPTRALPARS